MTERRKRLVRSTAALVLNDFWGKIIASLMVMAIGSGVAFALDMKSDQDIQGTKLEAIEKANIPPRLDKLEQKVDNVQDDVTDVKVAQQQMNQKMDYLIQQLLPGTHNPSPRPN